VAEEIESVVGPQRRLGRTVHVRVEPGVVHGDSVRIRQVMRNLLSNAFNHGGQTVWVTGATRGTEYLLVVADDGPGVGPETSGRLFKPFAHAGDVAVVSGSVGLGLSVARQLVRQLDGDLSYERNEGWTQFILRLPVGNTAAEGAAEADQLLETR